MPPAFKIFGIYNGIYKLIIYNLIIFDSIIYDSISAFKIF